MKTQILLPVLLTACALAAYFAGANLPSPSAPSGNIRAAALPTRNIQLSPRIEGDQETTASSSETKELRALLEHSLVTGGHARAFMELFTRDDRQFQEYIELALAQADHSCEPPTQFSKMTGPAQSTKPDATLEP